MKKLLSAFLATALVISLAACGGGEGSTPAAQEDGNPADGGSAMATDEAADADGTNDGAERTITWMTVRSSGWEEMELLADEYMAQNPNIKIEFYSPSDDRATYYQQLKILAGGNELPDLFDSDGDAMLAKIASTDVLVDIDEFFDEIGYDRMQPVGLNYSRLSDGKLYTICWENNIEYFWYNKDLFAQAGIEKTPETMDEFLQVCEQLKDAGIVPIATCTGWPALRYLSFVPFRLTGNEYIEKLKTGEAKMSDEVGMQAAEFFQELGTNYFMPGWATSDYSTALDAFQGGNAAIYNIGTWQFYSFLDDDNEMLPQFDFFYLPTMEGAVNERTTAYCAHAGTGTSINKATFDDDVKDFVCFILDTYPERAFYETSVVPPMTFDATQGELSDFEEQVLEDSDKLELAMYTWDVRLDSATNELLLKEIENLGMGTITPEEFAKRIDDAIAENAPKYFDDLG